MCAEEEGAGAALLRALLAPRPLAELSRARRERRPLMVRGAVERFARVGPPSADLGAVRAWLAGYSRSVRRARARSRGPVAFEPLPAPRRRSLAPGPGDWWRIDHLEGHFRRSREAYEALVAWFGGGLGTGITGFLHGPETWVPRHADGVSLLVLQLFGVRRWRLEANGEPPAGLWDEVAWGPREGAGWDAAFGPGAETWTLRPGALLFLPRGHWHAVRSAETSFALSVSLPEPGLRSAL
ncbi:MAG TPA: cupin domain-containing protein [Polyangiaceae bacterium LLY-WYZ-15_(1-7)]|nr:hypothetical protein [Myxococcales bacterium]MAT27364.1 hypothetical protein [Sandaracinus sp.]HJL04811.1 cupin domain-containing protein [Polyangiaceae bacterium LLY-WYZ-15_(1-7)]MBJ72500.1 hypothetical protein [Sandaracinus sp.]HJL09946.1 cupin domain-containing protein [Polyangiaceae bacterium LLY-WYZ-15_(1-7)]